MPRKDRYKVRAEVSNLQQQILAEVNEMMKTDTSSELTMLRDKVVARPVEQIVNPDGVSSKACFAGGEAGPQDRESAFRNRQAGETPCRHN